MFFNILILFGVILAGIFLSCKVFRYEISTARKFAAAGVFVVLGVVPVPIPLFSLVAPLVGLYVALMDDSYQRHEVNQVFGLTLLFAVVALLLVYLPQRP